MALMQLIYHSQPFGFEDAILAGILVQARRNNAATGLTGALIVRADLYLQLLEGPEDAVIEAFGKIKGDDRHLEVTSLGPVTVADRLFPEWTMRDDPARSWLWSAAEVRDGALTKASRREMVAVFERVAATVPA